MIKNIARSPRAHAFIPPLIIVLISLYMLLSHEQNRDISLLMLVFLVGAAGGVTSTYLRFKTLPVDTEAFKDAGDRSLAIIQVYFSPVIAGIFGWIIYSLFLTEIIKGPMFPCFEGVSDKYVNVSQLLTEIQPCKLRDAALVLVWAYIAGFSEKLIPNVIDKISSKMESA